MTLRAEKTSPPQINFGSTAFPTGILESCWIPGHVATSHGGANPACTKNTQSHPIPRETHLHSTAPQALRFAENEEGIHTCVLNYMSLGLVYPLLPPQQPLLSHALPTKTLPKAFLAKQEPKPHRSEQNHCRTRSRIPSGTAVPGSIQLSVPNKAEEEFPSLFPSKLISGSH